MKISIQKYSLIFKKAAGTSRGVLRKKNTWFVKIYEEDNPEKFGLGEINMFEGLSYDYRNDFYEKLDELKNSPHFDIENYRANLKEYPAILFGLETAILDYQSQNNGIIYPSAFTNGEKSITINGLIWMGDKDFMRAQIDEKIKNNFRCIKLKIGALNFDEELKILKKIRDEYNENELELRVDANGAFTMDDALEKLYRLSELRLHSIEQPIKQGNHEQMTKLCEKTPLPIALDEELIGINDYEKKKQLLSEIRPQYIILKPALLGGFKASEEWISLANKQNIAWWVTSALESNIGLNALAQWTFQLKNKQYQGLGTGQLFTNNFNAPLYLKDDKLFYHPNMKRELPKG